MGNIERYNDFIEVNKYTEISNKFSIAEKELICSYNLAHENSIILQLKFASELKTLYETGVLKLATETPHNKDSKNNHTEKIITATSDRWEADKYTKLIEKLDKRLSAPPPAPVPKVDTNKKKPQEENDPSKNQAIPPANQASQDNPDIKNSAEEIVIATKPGSIINSLNIRTFLGWYTSIRLFFSRSNRVAGVYHHGLIHHFSPITVTNVLGYMSLSYGIEALVDISLILKDTFFPKTLDERKKPIHVRFIDSFKKGARPKRLFNALLWLTVNLVAFILTGGYSALLNLIGFGFDILQDTTAEGLQVRKCETTKINLNSLLENEKNNSLKNSFEEIKEVTETRRVGAATETLIVLGITLGIFVGMALFYYLLPGLLVGAVVALVAGSVFGGFGRRMIRKAWAAATQKPTVEKEVIRSTTTKLLVNAPQNSSQTIKSADHHESKVNPPSLVDTIPARSTLASISHLATPELSNSTSSIKKDMDPSKEADLSEISDDLSFSRNSMELDRSMLDSTDSISTSSSTDSISNLNSTNSLPEIDQLTQRLPVQNHTVTPQPPCQKDIVTTQPPCQKVKVTPQSLCGIFVQDKKPPNITPALQPTF